MKMRLAYALLLSHGLAAQSYLLTTIGGGTGGKTGPPPG